MESPLSHVNVLLLASAKKANRMGFGDLVKLGNTWSSCPGVRFHLHWIQQPSDLDAWDGSERRAHVFLSKCTSWLQHEAEDATCAQAMEHIRAFMGRHGDALLLLDAPRVQAAALDRMAFNDGLQQALRPPVLGATVPVVCPSFLCLTGGDEDCLTDVDSLQAAVEGAGLSWPLLCKSAHACGTRTAHAMSLVWDAKALLAFARPAIVQQWHDHDGVLFKAFVVCDQVHVERRPSLTNATTLRQREAQRLGVPVDQVAQLRFNNADGLDAFAPSSDLQVVVPTPNQELLTTVAKAIRNHMGFSLFGFDILHVSNRNVWVVCDVNYFPGYAGVKDVHEKLITHVQTAVLQHQTQQQSS